MGNSLGPRAFSPHKGWHSRGYLPHFDAGAVVQAITFRLADSLPRKTYETLLATAKPGQERYTRIEHMIDEALGACLLRYADNAAIVQSALEHYDDDRYRLLAWVVMPNHVHTLIEQISGHPLGDTVRSWKSYSAKLINERMGSRGALWAPDYYDRFVRDEEHYANAVHYIENNPVKAGLVRHAHEWAFSSASERT